MVVTKVNIYICTYLAPILDGKCLINKVNTAFELWLYDMMHVIFVFFLCLIC